MDGIGGNGDDALKFTGAEIWRIYTWWGVFGMTPKIPIGTVGSPHFEDFTTPVEAPTTKTHQLIGVIQKIRQASLFADFSGKLNSALRKRIREPINGEFFLCQTGFSAYRQIGRQKAKDGG